jgi:hypothetical protein
MCWDSGSFDGHGVPEPREAYWEVPNPNQPVPSPLVHLTGRPETRSGPVFRVSSRFYGFLGVGPGIQNLSLCYLMGFLDIFSPMGLLTLWDPFCDSSLGRFGGIE